ncbi:hypothetical protein [Streptomyces sp. NPDC057554]|uniref:hypothetical protein n=1 Tax=Streptomyces sp. NPDC057554 TaxID=3350538 RepID=UPI00367BE698
MASSALDLLRWLNRPASVLELAARMSCPPAAAASSVAELLRPLNSGDLLPADFATPHPGGRALLARRVSAPSLQPASRLRAWTGPRPSGAGTELHHDLWLFASADHSARSALGPISPVGVMPLATPPTPGELWYGAGVDERAYTSLMAVCGLTGEDSAWEWLARTACGAVIITSGQDVGAVRAQAQAVAAHRIPAVVLVETGHSESTEEAAPQVLEALDLAADTCVVYGSATARCDLNEAVRRLEERG